MASTRVMLSDDHPFVRRGLRAILEATNKFVICGEASDGNQTMELAALLAPDILILDISMPGPNGLEVAANLRESLPRTKILLMTMHDSDEMLRAAAAVGVAGYILKSDAERLLMDALQSLQAGRTFVSPTFNPDTVKQMFH